MTEIRDRRNNPLIGGCGIRWLFRLSPISPVTDLTDLWRRGFPGRRNGVAGQELQDGRSNPASYSGVISSVTHSPKTFPTLQYELRAIFPLAIFCL